MKTQYIKASGVQNGIDFDAHYQVKGYRGIAFFLLGYEAENRAIMCYGTDDDGNEIEIESGDYELEATERIVAVMVGDDYRHVIDADDLIALPEDGYCRECGQVGCCHNVYSETPLPVA